MTPTQRETALRLAESLRYFELDEIELVEAADLLRELAAEPEPNPFVRTMAEQLLQVIAGIWTEHPDYSLRQTLNALNALMLPAEQGEPVLWFREFGAGPMLCAADHVDARPLYAAPQQRKPLKPLTLDRIAKLLAEVGADPAMPGDWQLAFVRAVEAAHGIGEQP